MIVPTVCTYTCTFSLLVENIIASSYFVLSDLIRGILKLSVCQMVLYLLAYIIALTTHVLLVRVEKYNLEVPLVPYEALTINPLLGLLVMKISSLALMEMMISLRMIIEEWLGPPNYVRRA